MIFTAFRLKEDYHEADDLIRNNCVGGSGCCAFTWVNEDLR